MERGPESGSGRFPGEPGLSGETGFNNPRSSSRRKRASDSAGRLAAGNFEAGKNQEPKAEETVRPDETESANSLLSQLMQGHQKPAGPENTARQERTESNTAMPPAANREPEHTGLPQPGSEFVLHLNDPEAPHWQPPEAQEIPLHGRESTQQMAAEPLPESAAHNRPVSEAATGEGIPPAGPAEADDFAAAPDARERTYRTAENDLFHPAEASDASAAVHNEAVHDSTTQQEQTLEPEAGERVWMSQLPPEMFAAPRYESAAGEPYVDSRSPSVTTGSRFAAASYAPEQYATRREVKRAVQEAAHDGVGRGLLTGALLGGLYEHFKHSGREKQQHKQTERLEKARVEYRSAAARQAEKQAQLERDLRASQLKLESPRMYTQNQATGRAANPNTYPASRVAQEERFAGPGASSEVMRQSRAAAPEQSPHDGPIAVPAGHRLSTEGWVITELDKTGKAVEQPTSFQYGQEFYNERAKESGPAAQRAAATGELAVAAAATSASQPKKVQAANPPAGGPTGIAALFSPATSIPNATGQGAPAAVRPSGTNAASDRSPAGKTATPSPAQSNKPLWPWLVALAAVALCLIFAL